MSSMMALEWRRSSSPLSLLFLLVLWAVIVPGRYGHIQPSLFEHHMGAVETDRRPSNADGHIPNIPQLFRTLLLRNNAASLRRVSPVDPTASAMRYLIDFWQLNQRDLNRPLPLFIGHRRVSVN